MRFAVRDVVKDELGGPYDLILCRDTLFHLPLWDAVAALRNLQATGSTYLLSHYDEELNTNWPDIAAGGWHVINLLAPPFKLPPPLIAVAETGNEGDASATAHYGHSRKLGLWKLPVLPAAHVARAVASSPPSSSSPSSAASASSSLPQPPPQAAHRAAAHAGGFGFESGGAWKFPWVGDKGQHGLKRCVVLAPPWEGGVEVAHPAPDGAWWPVDFIFSVDGAMVVGGVDGEESMASGARGAAAGGRVHIVPAAGVDAHVDAALREVAERLGLQGGDAGALGRGAGAGAELGGSGREVGLGGARGRGLLAAVWVGCLPVLLVGGWGAGVEGEEMLQVLADAGPEEGGGAAGLELRGIVDAVLRSGRVVLAVSRSTRRLAPPSVRVAGESFAFSLGSRVLCLGFPL